jgi:hypothetical protein
MRNRSNPWTDAARDVTDARAPRARAGGRGRLCALRSRCVRVAPRQACVARPAPAAASTSRSRVVCLIRLTERAGKRLTRSSVNGEAG